MSPTLAKLLVEMNPSGLHLFIMFIKSRNGSVKLVQARENRLDRIFEAPELCKLALQVLGKPANVSSL